MAPWLRRTWSLRGQPPVLLQRTRSHQKVSAVAALCVSPYREQVHLLFRLHPQANIHAALVVDFLRQLGNHLWEPIVLLWDRLLPHRARRVKTFLQQSGDIHAFFLPPYAPELNPVESVWGYLKTNPLANWAAADLHALTSVARRRTRSLQRKEHLLRSFLKQVPLFLRLR